MSMDYWLQAFDNGEGGFFPLSVVENAFGSAIVSNDNNGYLRLEYPSDPRFLDFIELRVPVFSTEEGLMTDGFAFVHAPGHKAFWQSLVDILRVTPTALYWADTQDALVIGQQETRQHLPPDMIETLGEPRLITSIQELFVTRPFG
ncbi:hypothetical protein [Superficieibacter sp. 1612_C1]|uniref:hypothetical protein n=1 Tax=Superficieibacter sp. 1612_C1 TaxID=2780382 RepID=UPI001883A362|nr:hypothetical protein [Superficieibacter sp. 1612_C1]